MTKCEKLEELLAKRYKDRPKALIIDDEWIDEASEVLPSMILEEVKEWISNEEDEVYDDFTIFTSEVSGEPKKDELLAFLQDNNLTLPVSIQDKVNSSEQDIYLSPLVCFLRENNFVFSGRVDYEEGGIKDLDIVFIDYQMPASDTTGVNATEIITKIADYYYKENKVPPVVILMSKALQQSDTGRWEGVANISGYFRFNFDFISKVNFSVSNVLNYSVYNLLKHRQVSKTYFETLQLFKTEAHSLAEKVTHELFKVTPAEIKFFKNRVAVDGGCISLTLRELFVKCFGKEVQRSSTITDSLINFVKSLDDFPLSPPKESHQPILNMLYSDLLYEHLENSKSPRFGDIYSLTTVSKRKTIKKFYLLISQDCDLASSSERKPIDKLLCLEGEEYTGLPKQNTPKAIHYPSWKESRSICWNLKDTFSFGYSEFLQYSSNLGSIKRTKRNQYRLLRCQRLTRKKTEYIRNLFSQNLSRLAFDVEPAQMKRLRIKCHDANTRLDIDGYLSLAFVEQTSKKLFIAIENAYESLEQNLKSQLGASYLVLSEFQEFQKFKSCLINLNMNIWLNNDSKEMYVVLNANKNQNKNSNWNAVDSAKLFVNSYVKRNCNK